MKLRPEQKIVLAQAVGRVKEKKAGAALMH